MLVLNDLLEMQTHSHNQSTEKGRIREKGVRPGYPFSVELLDIRNSYLLTSETAGWRLTATTASPSLNLGAMAALRERLVQ